MTLFNNVAASAYARRKGAALKIVRMQNPKRRAHRKHNSALAGKKNPSIRKANKRRGKRRNSARNPAFGGVLSMVIFGGAGAAANRALGGILLTLPFVSQFAQFPFARPASHFATALGLRWASKKLLSGGNKADLVFTGAAIETGLTVIEEIVPNYQSLAPSFNSSPVMMSNGQPLISAAAAQQIAANAAAVGGAHAVDAMNNMVADVFEIDDPDAFGDIYDINDPDAF